MKKTRAYAGNRALCLLLSQLRVLADTVRSFTLWIKPEALRHRHRYRSCRLCAGSRQSVKRKLRRVVFRDETTDLYKCLLVAEDYN